jgi:hypothetical protein
LNHRFGREAQNGGGSSDIHPKPEAQGGVVAFLNQGAQGSGCAPQHEFVIRLLQQQLPQPFRALCFLHAPDSDLGRLLAKGLPLSCLACSPSSRHGLVMIPRLGGAAGCPQ